MATYADVLAGRLLVDMEKGEISRDIFVDPELYEIEKEQVFARVWLFIGFEDQVKKPGDYFVSRMGEESVILSRDRDNQIHVFLNSCRHRGMKVCRYDEGNTPVFTCPYHGWSYAGDGSLVGVPRYKDAYREELDKSQWGLVEVAQMTNFRGAIWATWDPSAPSFEEYIGDLKPMLELFYDKPDGTEGELEYLGMVKWLFSSNWKFGAENFIGDGYHGRPTHRSVDLLSISPSGKQGRHTGDNVDRPNTSPRHNMSYLGSGLKGTVILNDTDYSPTYPNNPVAEEYFRDAHYKRQKLQNIQAARAPTGGGTIFPNGTCGTNQSMCVWNPHGADWTECWRSFFVHKDAPQEVKDLLRHYYIRYGGPAGMTEEDDMENWNYAQKASKGVIARRHPYNYSIGLRHEYHGGGPYMEPLGLMKRGTLSLGVDEHNQRQTYKVWADLMAGMSWDEVVERNAS